MRPRNSALSPLRRINWPFCEGSAGRLWVQQDLRCAAGQEEGCQEERQKSAIAAMIHNTEHRFIKTTNGHESTLIWMLSLLRPRGFYATSISCPCGRWNGVVAQLVECLVRKDVPQFSLNFPQVDILRLPAFSRAEIDF